MAVLSVTGVGLSGFIEDEQVRVGSGVGAEAMGAGGMEGVQVLLR